MRLVLAEQRHCEKEYCIARTYFAFYTNQPKLIFEIMTTTNVLEEFECGCQKVQIVRTLMDSLQQQEIGASVKYSFLHCAYHSEKSSSWRNRQLLNEEIPLYPRKRYNTIQH